MVILADHRKWLKSYLNFYHIYLNILNCVAHAIWPWHSGSLKTLVFNNCHISQLWFWCGKAQNPATLPQKVPLSQSNWLGPSFSWVFWSRWLQELTLPTITLLETSGGWFHPFSRVSSYSFFVQEVTEGGRRKNHYLLPSFSPYVSYSSPKPWHWDLVGLSRSAWFCSSER